MSFSTPSNRAIGYMCGIVGVYDTSARVTQEDLRRMNTEITHRGPDDEGYYLDGPVGLGMRRLSIIDVGGGHQPIANEDESCWIVFNGEIYNYRELRDELRQQGHRFRSHSDTETILHQYEQSGAECVHRLNGMFAFAIWDSVRRTLLIARDRLGIKPLYYYWDGRSLLFASEIKAILASGRVKREVNREALWDYLSFRYVPAPNTIWQGVRKLPPGHTLTLNAKTGTLQIGRYWDIRYASDPAPASEEDLETFSSLFVDSVRRRLIADVPVGILLSGGLDSSAVAAAVSEVHNAPLKTFSVAFAEGGNFDETRYAREVAEHFGTDHHEVVINYDDFTAFLPEFVWYTDEPLADPASVPLYYVSRLAADHVKVVLSGEGADEVLAGYDFNDAVAQWERLARFQRLPTWLRDTLPRAAFSLLRNPQRLARIERANVPLAEQNHRMLPYMTGYFSDAEKRDLWPEASRIRSSDDVVRGYYERAGSPDPLHQALYAYCQDWLVEDLLMKADKMTMANSLELRVPFLDYRLVEWLATRGPELKVNRGVDGQLKTKHLLRQFAEARLPASIIQRPKLGFPVPLNDWLRGPLGSVARTKLLAGGSFVSSWSQRESLERIVCLGTTTHDAVAQQRLWLLLVLELWTERWL